MADETADVEVTESEKAERTFTQEEVDRLVGNARTKERKKYADYDDLRVTVEQLQSQLADMEKQRETERQREKWIADAAKDTGVPVDVLQLISADSADDLKAKAAAVSAHFKQAPLPVVSGDGKKPEKVPSDVKSDFARQLFGEDK